MSDVVAGRSDGAAARVAGALVAVAVLSQAFIDGTVSLPLPGWHLDAPVADLAGVALVALLPWWWRAAPSRPAPPAPLAAAAFAAVGLVAALTAAPEVTLQSPAASVHQLLRKPVFAYVAWGVALPLALALVPLDRVRRLLAVAIAATAIVSVTTSALRVVAGGALWWASLEGLTPNHKTLAVWMAPFVPWLWARRGDAWAKAAGVAVLVALPLSGSKAALITAAFGLAWAIHVGGRPLVARKALTAVGLAGAFAAALYAPLLVGSRAMQDAMRSRQSIDLRQWTMFAERPLLGQGPGSSVTWEMHEYPHYRINGVEAHGVLQKVAAELGLLGLGAWLAFTALLFVAATRTARRAGTTRGEAWGWLGVVAALHVNLVLSTEAFTMTHWIPLGVAWAMLPRVVGEEATCAS